MRLLCYTSMVMELISTFSEIGTILRERRIELGKSASELAALAGIERSTLSRIESGKTNPSWALVLALGQALDMQPVLVPRQRLRAVEAVVRMNESAEAPPSTGDEW